MTTIIFLLIVAKLTLAQLGTGGEVDGARPAVAYAPDALLIIVFMLCAARLALRRQTPRLVLVMSGFLAIATFCVAATGMLNDVPLEAELQSLSRTVLPLLLIAVVYSLTGGSRTESDVRRLYQLTRLLSLVIVLLTVLGIATLPPVQNRNETWMPAYFSGLHSSCYTLLAGLACSYAAYRYRGTIFNRNVVLLYAIFTLYMLIVGWGIRSAALAFLIVVVGIYFNPRKASPLVVLFVLVIVAAGALSTLIGLGVVPFFAADLITSGRLSMYNEKIAFLSNYTLTEWLFGRGAGSDLMVSTVWWWAEKGAHNDFMTFTVEHGLLFLITVLAAIRMLYKRLGGLAEKSIFAAVLLTSMISNGYLVRPVPFYCLVFPLVLLARTGESARTLKSLRKLSGAKAATSHTQVSASVHPQG